MNNNTLTFGPLLPNEANRKVLSIEVAGSEGWSSIPSEAQLRMTSDTLVKPMPSDGVTGPVDSVATADSRAGYSSFAPL